MADPSTYVEFKLGKRLTNIQKLALQVIVCLAPTAIIVSFLHETGHAIAGLMLGFQIKEIHFSFLPFVFDFSNPFVRMLPPLGTTTEGLVFVSLAGSGATLFWGLVFFICYYKWKLPQFLEVFFLVYSVMLVLDMAVYSIGDIFFMQIGDFDYIFSISPPICGLVIGSVIGLFVAFVYYRDRIIDRWEVEV